MAESTAIRVRISGRVQGVGYRNWCVREATQLGINGWVRNRADGTVEALFEGRKVAVEKMITLCHEGPLFADVSTITSEPAKGITEKGFRQLPTV